MRRADGHNSMTLGRIIGGAVADVRGEHGRLALGDAAEVAQDSRGRGPAAGALPDHGDGAGILALIAGEVEVFEHGALGLAGREQDRLDIGGDTAVGSPAARGDQAAGPAAGHKVGHVGGAEAVDALVEETLLRQDAPGDGAGQHNLAQGVEARDIGRGVGLGIAELLGLLQGVGIVHAGGLHPVEHEVGGTVEDAADGENLIRLHGTGEVMQEGHPAAAGGAEEEGHTLLVRRMKKLDTPGSDQGFVGGDKMLAGTDGRHGIGKSRFDTAHDFGHRIHGRVGDDLIQIADLEIRILFARTHQHRAGFEAFGLLQHLINADTDGAVTQNRNFHKKAPSVSVMFVIERHLFFYGGQCIIAMPEKQDLFFRFRKNWRFSTMLSNYLIVHKSILPEYYEKVLECRRLMESGKVREVSQAVKQVGISRSTYYKYKDYIFEPNDLTGSRKAVFSMMLDHEPGVLSGLLKCLSDLGASVLTITQSLPIHNKASVTISIDITNVKENADALPRRLSSLPGLDNLKMIAIE